MVHFVIPAKAYKPLGSAQLIYILTQKWIPAIVYLERSRKAGMTRFYKKTLLISY